MSFKMQWPQDTFVPSHDSQYLNIEISESENFNIT